MRHPTRPALLGISGAATALLIGFTLAIPAAQTANAQQIPNPTCGTCSQAVNHYGGGN